MNLFTATINIEGTLSIQKGFSFVKNPKNIYVLRDPVVRMTVDYECQTKCGHVDADDVLHVINGFYNLNTGEIQVDKFNNRPNIVLHLQIHNTKHVDDCEVASTDANRILAHHKNAKCASYIYSMKEGGTVFIPVGHVVHALKCYQGMLDMYGSRTPQSIRPVVPKKTGIKELFNQLFKKPKKEERVIHDV